MEIQSIIILILLSNSIPVTIQHSLDCSCDTSNVNRNIYLPRSIASPRPRGEPDAVRQGDLLYIRRQIGEDLLTRRLVPGHDLFQECQLAFNNTLLILNYTGCTYRNVALFTDLDADSNYGNLELIDRCQGSLGLTTATPDTIYRAGRGYGVGYILAQNSSFEFDFIAYACQWTKTAQAPNSDARKLCSCQKPYHHHAWNLPANVSAPVALTKGFRRVSRAGNNVYVTGTVGQSFLTGEVVPGGLEAQLRKSLDNVALQLKQAGCTFENVVQVETLLLDWSLVDEVDRLYKEYFADSKNVQEIFIGSERLITGLKLGAVISHIVDAKDCQFTQPQYSVTSNS